MSTVDEYLRSTRRSREVYDHALRLMPSGINRSILFYDPYPTFASRAKGSRIWDIDGNERIDYCFNMSTLVLGHNNPKVVQAARELLESGFASGAPTELEIDLADEIRRRMPSIEKIRFAPSGTEAVMNAIRLCRAFTGKSKILMFEGGYHGTYDAVFPLTEGLPRGSVDDTIVVPFNDPEAIERVLREKSAELAAVIIEPILGSCGSIPPKEGFLKIVREQTEREGVLLIFDEVITGFRVARGGAQEYYNIEPDLTILGKIIGGGFPVGAFGGREDIMELCSVPRGSTFELGRPRVTHSGTFSSHPLAMAAGLATVKELSPQVYEHLNRTGAMIRNGMRSLSDSSGIRFQSTGIGSLFHIFFTDEEVTDYRTSQTASAHLLSLLDLSLLNHGVYFAPRHFCNVSAATTEDDVRATLNAVGETLEPMKQTAREVAPDLV